MMTAAAMTVMVVVMLVLLVVVVMLVMVMVMLVLILVVIIVMVMIVVVTAAAMVIMIVLVMVVMMMLVLFFLVLVGVLFVGLGSHGDQLSLEVVLGGHGLQDLLTGQVIPCGGHDSGGGVLFPQHCHAAAIFSSLAVWVRLSRMQLAWLIWSS